VDSTSDALGRRVEELEQEAIARQHAITAVLKAMGGPRFDLEAVLTAIVSSAVALGHAEFGIIYLREGDQYRAAAGIGQSAIKTLAYEHDHPDHAGRHSMVGRVIQARDVVQIEDTLADPEYDQPVAQKDGFRTLMGVPILQDDELSGIIGVARTVVRPFSDAEVALLQTFAGQAAVAIENARRIGEQLARQAAMTEVLRIIGRSELDLGAVLTAIVATAIRLCGAEFGTVYLQEGDVYRIAAAAGFHDEAIREYERARPHRPGRESMTGRVLLTGQAQQIPDVLADAEYDQPEAQRISGFRTLLGVPIIREGRIAGVFNLGRSDVRPFSEDEIALGATFAEQVAIAIQNARLFDEQLARQAAMTEVLRVIGRSEHGLDAVLKAIVESAAELCHAPFGTIYLRDGDVYRAAAGAGQGGEATATYERDHPDRPGRHSVVGRVLLSHDVVQIEDVHEDPEYDQPVAQQILALRTILGVPIVSDGELIGVFNMGRPEAAPFDAAEIALVTTFSEQVAIAIETARLLETIDRQRIELARFVSPQIAALVSSPQGEELLAGHRRRITAVFCDLRGFSHFSETAEPEEVLELLREYHQALGASIVEHGATLEHFAGDGLLAFLNDPIEQPDHELQAVAMAIDMRTRVGELAAGWRKRGYELGLGIGLVAGYATLGRIGFEGRYDYGAVGNAVILASRLSSEAAAGQILLDQRTHAAIEDGVEVVAAGDLMLKGISRPVVAFDVVGLR
jgi:GAF domain-containing protein